LGVKKKPATQVRGRDVSRREGEEKNHGLDDEKKNWKRLIKSNQISELQPGGQKGTKEERK